MSLPADRTIQRSRFTLFLAQELRPRPGRLTACLRVTVSCVVIVILGMTFQIPLPAYMAYLVFLVSREESVSTYMTGVASLMAVTIAIMLTILLYIVDAGEPGLRLPVMALYCFLAMYLVRACSLGPVAFLAGFILVLSQTLIDDAPGTEFLVRSVLWLWLVIALPSVLAVAVEMTFGLRPLHLARGRFGALLDELAHSMEEAEQLDVWRFQVAVMDVRQLVEKAKKFDAGLRSKRSIDARMFDGVIRLISLVSILPPSTPPDLRSLLAGALRGYRVALLGSETAGPIAHLHILPKVIGANAPEISAVAAGIARVISELTESASRQDTDMPHPKPGRSPFFVADAFTNPAYARFALKTTIAVMVCYVIYTLLDWPGIRTSVTTCFFVALGSVGETVHKLSLRLSGAIIGGLLAGLCLVFVVPLMTDVGQLGVLVAAVSVACAWVATSSERLSYAGLQMAFAFFLGIFQGYGPPTDLTELRDRVVGILLGNVVMTVVFTTLWPVSAVQVARATLGRVFGSLALLLQSDVPRPTASLELAENVLRARGLAGSSMFEMPFVSRGFHREVPGSDLITQVARVASAATLLSEQDDRHPGDGPLAHQEGLIAAWLSGVGQALIAGTPIPAYAETASQMERIEDERGSVSALACLNRECAHVASLL